MSVDMTVSTMPSSKDWWIDKPIRMALLLFNQYQAPLDTDAFVQKLVDLDVNALVLPVGGIAAWYPTEVPFHVRAPSLPAGRDLVGEILEKAHAEGIYVVARFEWTVSQDKTIAEAHPEWLQRDPNGNSPRWNDTHLMCVNGGYMQEHIFKIMDEALTRFPLDGMFFNYGGGQRNAFGPCQCDNCQQLYRQAYGSAVPEAPNEQYIEFMNACAGRLASKIRAFAKAKRPEGFNFMVGKDADSTNSETHSAPIAEAHAYWLYDASETVNRARAAHPDRMQFNNDAAFLDGRWRYAHRSAPDGEIRAFQNMANGAGPYLFLNGNHEQFDRNGEKGARPAFRFHKNNEDLFVRQENAARVLLLDEPGPSLARMLFRFGQSKAVDGNSPGNGGFGYRDSTELGSGPENHNTAMAGFFRILTEKHIPFVLSRDLSWIDSDPGRYDLVVASRAAPAALDTYLKRGGKVLAAGATKPDLDLPRVVKQWARKDTLASYWRVRDHALLPSLKDADLVFFYSDYLELESPDSALTMVPRTKVNPMEMVGEGMTDTVSPGLHLADYGQGKLAFIPWDIGDLYFRASNPFHAGLVADLVDHLLPDGRQIRTNAHPMVQMTLQRQKHCNRTLVHFVNLSGASQVAYHNAIPMGAIHVEVQGDFSSARAASTGRELTLSKGAGYVSFTLPQLDTYDVAVLQDA